MLYQYSNFFFPFLILLGIVAGVLLIIYKVKKLKLDKKSFDRLLTLFALSGALFYIGSRLFDDLFHRLNGELDHKGGITFMAGMITAVTVFVVCFIIFLKPIRKMFFKIVNIVVIGIVLGHAIGRIGCFLSGCCYGKITDSKIGVVFPGTYDVQKNGSLYYIHLYGSDAYEDLFQKRMKEYIKENNIARYNDTSERTYYYDYFYSEEVALEVANDANSYALSTRILPTQLFESLFLFILFGVLMIIPNLQGGIYLMSYGAFRFAIEFLRNDNRGSVLLGISPSQLLSILIIVVGIIYLIFNIRQNKLLKIEENQPTE